MSDLTIDSVSVQINSNSEKATSGIKGLIGSLNMLKNVTGKSVSGLMNLNQALNNITKSFSSLSKISSSLSGVNKETKSLKNSAKTLKGTKLSLNTRNLTNGKKEIIDTKSKLIELQKQAGNKYNVNASASTSGIDQIMSKFDVLEQKMNTTNSTVNLLLGRMGKIDKPLTRAGAAGKKLQLIFSTMGKSLSGAWNGLKKILEYIKTIIGWAKKMATGMGKATGASSFKQATKNAMKYVLALFSIRGAYALVNSAANNWLSSASIGAQQLQANMDYLKYALGSAVAPAITAVANLIYGLMKAIQQVIYYFSGINIFANAFAKNMKKAAGGAAATKKELKQIAGFDELNTIDFGDKSKSGGGGGGDVGPTFDLTKIDGEISGLAQKLIDFFKPLKESWDIYGPSVISQLQTTASQVGGLISSVWGSFEKTIINGTAYKLLNSILKLIGDIAYAFQHAWDNNGNGDTIIQNLVTTFTNLFTAIDDFVTSEGFQKWLDNAFEKLKNISEKISQIDWTPFVEAIGKIGEAAGDAALLVLEKIVDIVKWFGDNPGAIKAVGLAVAALIGFKVLWSIGGAVVDFKNKWNDITDLFKKGQKSTDAVKDSIDGIGKVSQTTDKSTSGLSTTFKGFFDGLGKGIQAIAILGGIALVIESLTDLIKAFSESGLSLQEAAGLIISSIGSIVLGFTAMMGVMSLMQPSWQSIAGAAVILGGFALVIETVSHLLTAFSKSGMKVGDVVTLMVTIFGSLVLLMTAVATIGPLMTAGIVPFAAVAAIVSGILIVMAATLPTILDAIGKFIDTMADALVNILHAVRDVIVDILDALGRNLPIVVDSIIKLLDNIWGKLKELWSWLSPIITAIITKVGEIWNKVKEVFGNVWNKVKEVFTNVWNKVKEVVGNIKTIVDEKIKAVKDKFGEIWTKVKDVFSNIWTKIKDTFKNIVDTVKDKIKSIKDKFGEIGTKVKDVWDGIKKKFTEKLSIKLPHIQWVSGGFETSGLIKKALEALSLPTSLPKLKVDWYADGGFPTTGDLFIANEAGPEWIAKMGNSTAVANQDQMTTALEESSYRGVARALAENPQNQKTEVYIGNDKVYSGYANYQNRQNNKYGVNVVRV